MARPVSAEVLEKESGMMKRWKISKLSLASSVLIAAILSGSAAAESVGLCKELSGFSLKSAPWPKAVERLLLDTVPDPKEAFEHYLNLDVDGDDVNDSMEKSCPANPESGADPCPLTLKLSSSGKTLEFNAWGFQLFRYRGQIFIVANADETRRKTNIYGIEKSGFRLICGNL